MGKFERTFCGYPWCAGNSGGKHVENSGGKHVENSRGRYAKNIRGKLFGFGEKVTKKCRFSVGFQ
jgi:hypothetical protein